MEKNNNSIKQLGDTVTKQMQENLYTVTDYLTQLDTQIRDESKYAGAGIKFQSGAGG